MPGGSTGCAGVGAGAGSALDDTAGSLDDTAGSDVEEDGCWVPPWQAARRTSRRVRFIVRRAQDTAVGAARHVVRRRDPAFV